MSNQENNVPNPQIKEINSSRAKSKISHNERVRTPGGVKKPRLDEPFSVEGKKQPEFDRELWEKNSKIQEKEIQGRANKAQPSKGTTTKKPGKIGQLFKSAAKSLGTFIKFGSGIGSAIGVAYEFLDPPSTATDEQERALAQKYYEEKENNAIDITEEEKAQEKELIKDNYTDTPSQIDKEQIINNLSEQLEISQNVESTEPSIEEKDQIISSLQSEDYDDLESTETFEISDIEKEQLITSLNDSEPDSIEMDESFYFEDRNDIGENDEPDIGGDDGGGDGD